MGYDCGLDKMTQDTVQWLANANMATNHQS
jgi:hypothetical protein